MSYANSFVYKHFSAGRPWRVYVRRGLVRTPRPAGDNHRSANLCHLYCATPEATTISTEAGQSVLILEIFRLDSYWISGTWAANGLVMRLLHYLCCVFCEPAPKTGVWKSMHGRSKLV